jgi:hypothetical protein
MLFFWEEPRRVSGPFAFGVRGIFDKVEASHGGSEAFVVSPSTLVSVS